LPHSGSGVAVATRGQENAVKALTYHGSNDVRVETMPDPTIAADDDIVLRVTATAICGSDLHIYRGKIPDMKSGDILGHEFMGVVEAAGRGVTRLRPGDRVVVPFTISCGDCFFCQRSLFARGRGPACSATATCTAAIPAGRRSSCGCRAPTSARWSFPIRR
jgi:threonine dehydrogenase-like Zn-dependent dehydrogenase